MNVQAERSAAESKGQAQRAARAVDRLRESTSPPLPTHGTVVFGALALCVLSCTPPWSPASVVDSLRVIAVRAEPPEIRPGQTAVLSSLVLDPVVPAGQGVTTLWVGCDPDPFNEGRGACSDVTALQDPGSLVDAANLPAGVKIIGFNEQASYATDPGLFDVLDAGDDRRIIGTVGLVVSITVAETVSPTATDTELSALAAQIRSGDVATQTTLFRVTVSENPNPNHNPIFDSFLINGTPLAAGATASFLPGAMPLFDLTAHDLEMYDEITPTGVEHDTEQFIGAWYTTSGRFSHDRVALFSGVLTSFTQPEDDDPVNDDVLPADRRGTFWSVLRDSRGGQTWDSWPFFVCDPSLPTPHVTSVDTSSDGGSTLVLHGTHLDQLLDVIVDGGAVPGTTDSTAATWTGSTTQLGPVTVTGKDCSNDVIASP